MSETPERRARALIDAQLQAAGWLVQDRDEMNLGAGLGVAVREFLTSSGPCDSLLFVDRRACGVIEAKPAGKTLSGVAEQAASYQHQLPGHLANWGDPLRFHYEASGTETLFSDRADPEQRNSESDSHSCFANPWRTGQDENENWLIVSFHSPIFLKA